MLQGAPADMGRQPQRPQKDECRHRNLTQQHRWGSLNG